MHVGCCGFPVARQRYFESFRVVEMQQTFYQPPQIFTALRWRLQAPSNFEYTLKAWQLITHTPSSPTYRKLRVEIPASKEKCYGSFKPTDEVFAAWATTKEIADCLQARIVVFECPASFEPTRENMRNVRKFFSAISSDRYVFAWEPRGEWGTEEIHALCQEMNLVHCVDPSQSIPVAGQIHYYRLHGIGGYRHKYTRDELKALEKQTRGTQIRTLCSTISTCMTMRGHSSNLFVLRSCANLDLSTRTGEPPVRACENRACWSQGAAPGLHCLTFRTSVL